MEFHSKVSFDEVKEKDHSKTYLLISSFSLFLISVFLLASVPIIEMELEADYIGENEKIDIYSGATENFSIVQSILAYQDCERYTGEDMEDWEFNCVYSELVNPLSNFP